MQQIAELIQDANEKAKLSFPAYIDSSTLSTWRSCRRKYFWSHDIKISEADFTEIITRDRLEQRRNTMGGQGFKCPMCVDWFLDKPALKLHMISAHPDLGDFELKGVTQFTVVEQKVKPTKTQLQLLSRYKRDTHSVQLPHEEAREMEKLGWVSWQPPIFGTNNLYYLTDAGRMICEEQLWGNR